MSSLRTWPRTPRRIGCNGSGRRENRNFGFQKCDQQRWLRWADHKCHSKGIVKIALLDKSIPVVELDFSWLMCRGKRWCHPFTPVWRTIEGIGPWARARLLIEWARLSALHLTCYLPGYLPSCLSASSPGVSWPCNLPSPYRALRLLGIVLPSGPGHVQDFQLDVMPQVLHMGDNRYQHLVCPHLDGKFLPGSLRASFVPLSVVHHLDKVVPHLGDLVLEA